MSDFKLLDIKINDFGGSPFADHNYPCPVYPENKAVLVINRGYFQPSWIAQKKGFKLVKLDTLTQKLLYKIFFKKEYEIGG